MARTPVFPLADLLAAQGFAPLGDPSLDALARVTQRAAQRGAARDAARADLPAPLPPASGYPEGRLSPRLLVLLARALDTRAGQHVVLMGEPLAALAAVLLELDTARRPAHITLHTLDPTRANLTLERLLDETSDRPVDVHDRDALAPDGGVTAERVLSWRSTPDAAPPPVPDDGTLLRIELHGTRPQAVQETHSGGEIARIDLGGYDPTRLEPRAARPRPAGPTGTSRSERDTAPIRRLLMAERMQQNVWRGQATSRVEAGVALAVRRLFEDAPEPPGGTPQHALARLLLHLGYLEQVTATRRGAEALYLASLAACPTAEGWTFLGWARAQQGRLAAASEACEQAIHTDPTLGNPYNDLGAYRLSEGKRTEAKTWFKRATEADRYMAPHYPYTNLARIHYEEGDLDAARDAAEEALARMPGYRPAERLLRLIGHRDSGEP